MTSRLISAYDKTLERTLFALGLHRRTLGLYAKSDSDEIWKGLWLVFDQRHDRINAAPILGIFCPSASTMADDGYRTLYGNAARDQLSELGRPLISHPLYDLVRKQCGEDRHSFSYDIETIGEINAVTSLIRDDLLKVADSFFGHTSTVKELRDRIVSHPTSVTAGIDAMILTYIVDPQVSLEELQKLTHLSDSPMTKEFAMYFKTKIIEIRRRS